MSADIMIICKEDKSYYDGDGSDKAFCIGETCETSKFTKWFSNRFDGSPSILDQIAGNKDHAYSELTQVDAEAIIKQAIEVGSLGFDRDDLAAYVNSHVGSHISVECW